MHKNTNIENNNTSATTKMKLIIKVTVVVLNIITKIIAIASTEKKY